MIAHLKGTVIYLDAGEAILDVQGVGYSLSLCQRTLQSLQLGQEAAFWTETLVRQDALSLIGFATRADQSLFRLLVTIQGVGAKLALSVLSLLTPEAFWAIVAKKDKKALLRVDGVGSRMADRLIVECGNKIPAPLGTPEPETPPPAAFQEALSALKNLGYAEREVLPVLKDLDPAMPLDQLLKQMLSHIGAARIYGTS